MAPLTSAPSYAKVLLVGDSKAGKTTALISLLREGYNLRVLDMDCKLPGSYLHTLAKREGLDKQIDFIQLRDKTDPRGYPIGGAAQVCYNEARRCLDKWDDGSKPSEWGDRSVFVVDTLNLLSKAAFNQAIALNPKHKSQQLWYGAAQKAVEGYMSVLTSDLFSTHVIVLSHIVSVPINMKIDEAGDRVPAPNSPIRDFPMTIGQAFSRTVAVYFNNLFKIERRGQGAAEKRVILTRPAGNMDLGAGLDLPGELPAETGLATIFKELQK